MRRLFILAILCVAAWPAASHAAGPPLKKVLPPGAKILRQTSIAGYRHALAVAYSAGGPRIGVAFVGNGHDTLLWSTGLPSKPLAVLSPGPAGAFVVLLHGSGGSDSVSAFRLHSGRVSWALLTGKGRPITAASVTVKTKSIVTTSPDAGHIGSVPYRFRTVLAWSKTGYLAGPTVHEPDLTPSQYPKPNGVIHTAGGDTVLIKLETAWTLEQQETGLMHRTSLDPDSGMVFVWSGLVGYTFTMANTLIPLTVAFLGPDGAILGTRDMTPLDTTTPYALDPSECASRNPGQCYQFAIEVNKGFFAANNVRVGDKVVLSLPCSSFPGFHSAYVKCYS